MKFLHECHHNLKQRDGRQHDGSMDSAATTALSRSQRHILFFLKRSAQMIKQESVKDVNEVNATPPYVQSGGRNGRAYRVTGVPTLLECV
jgi:hypothetical protein